MPNEKPNLQEIHKHFAVNLFNETWDLLDKTERSHEETLLMIHKAHASLYHWLQIGTPNEFCIGEWQLARVYSVANMPESALVHAQRCLTICKENEMKGFNLAYAYEAMARAYHLAGNAAEFEHYYQLAKSESAAITEEASRKMLLDDLQTIK